MADIVKNAMKETGISITDFLAAAIEIAHQEHPSELVERRDDIIQGLYDVVPCVKCVNTGRQHVHSTGALISEVEESQNPLTDLGEANFSDQSEEVAKDSHQEQPSEKTGIRIVIKLNKTKNKSADATERPKSEEIKPIEAATNNSIKTDDFLNEDISGIKFEKAAKRKLHESYELAANAKCLKNEEEDINGIKFENAKRKLHEGYELAANAKKQHCIKMVAPHQLPTQKLGNRTQQKNQHSSSAKARIESKLKKLKTHRR